MSLWSLLGIREKEAEKKENLGQLFDKIQRIAENRTREEIKRITGFAGLLGKVAYADMEISEVEVRQMRKLLTEKMRLAPADADAILEMIQEHRVQLLSIEDHNYVRLINAVSDKQQKTDLLKTLFTVAAANDSISAEEDTAIRLIAQGLRLAHKDFIQARSGFKEHLEVLKGMFPEK